MYDVLCADAVYMGLYKFVYYHPSCNAPYLRTRPSQHNGNMLTHNYYNNVILLDLSQLTINKKDIDFISDTSNLISDIKNLNSDTFNSIQVS